MADTPETIIRVGADTKPAEQAFDDLGERIGGIGKKIGATLAAYLSVRAISAAFDKAIESAIEAEKATKAFNSALAMSGQFSTEAAAGFAEFASSLEKTTGVEDELILSNAALLVSIGKLSGDGLERATKAALDLSKGMQIDVGTAFDIVTKATQGNVMALSRYGLEVAKTDTDAKKFAKTLDFIQSKFGGLSSGSINSFSGALNKLKNGFNDTFESAGLLITKNPKIIASLSVFGDVFYKISKAIASSNVNLSKFVDALFNIGKFLLTFVVTPIEALVRWMITTTMAIPNLMMSLYTGLASVSDKLFGTDLQSKIEPVKQMLLDLQMAAAAPLFTDDQLFTTRLSNLLDKTKQKIDELAKAIQVELPQAITNGTNAAAPEVESFSNGFIEGLKNMAKSTTELGKTVANTFVNGITNSFAAVGKALIEGGNAFGAFGKAILMMLGNIALQMGSFYIAAGIAAMFLNPAQGTGMIAAGAGLSVLGGILQALGAGGGAPAPATGAVGGAGTMTANPLYTSPMTEQTPEEARAAAQTGVQVIVQGNIFDSRETGLQIAQIINDSFDLNGTIIRANA